LKKEVKILQIEKKMFKILQSNYLKIVKRRKRKK